MTSWLSVLSVGSVEIPLFFPMKASVILQPMAKPKANSRKSTMARVKVTRAEEILLLVFRLFREIPLPRLVLALKLWMLYFQAMIVALESEFLRRAIFSSARQALATLIEERNTSAISFSFTERHIPSEQMINMSPGVSATSLYPGKIFSCPKRLSVGAALGSPFFFPPLRGEVRFSKRGSVSSSSFCDPYDLDGVRSKSLSS